MVHGGDVLSWMLIGLAASLAGMALPFRRGLLGVLVNIGASVAGAVAVALLSYVFVPRTGATDTPSRLFFAVVGALLGLGLAHLVWSRWVVHLHLKPPASPAQRSPAA